METNRAAIPKAYDAVQKGLVTSVKNQNCHNCQRSCSSCAAHATISVIETCFKKKTGVFGEFY